MAATMNKCFSVARYVKNVHSRASIPLRRTMLSSSVVPGGSHKQQCSCLSMASATGISEAFQQATQPKKEHIETLSLFRTTESDPTKHTPGHTGLYFTVDKDDYNRYMSKGLHEKFHQMGVAFNEHCIMVREPSVEILDCLRATDFALPNVRYIIYGQMGAGKSITLAHTMAYCGRLGWFVVHVPWLDKFIHYPKEIQISSHNKDRIDTPAECCEWISYFQQMNAPLIPKVKLLNTYTWTKRESTEAGASLSELLEYGLTRTKYAADVMGAVLKELRQQSSQGMLHTLIAIDGANALWVPSKITRIDNRQQQYSNDELSVIYNLKKSLSTDWNGGATVITVDSRCAPRKLKESYMPRYLLPKEAIDLLEPHIPINLQNYSKKEAYSCMDYFIDRKWIQRIEGLSEEGKREVLFLSSQNPLEMYNVCARW